MVLATEPAMPPQKSCFKADRAILSTLSVDAFDVFSFSDADGVLMSLGSEDLLVM